MRFHNVGALTGVGAGLAFAVFPLLRPWGDKQGGLDGMTAAFVSPLWVASHLVGMVAWILLSASAVAATRRVPALLMALGTMLVLPFYGAEAFGLHGLATTGGDIMAGQAAIRGGVPQMVMFASGLVLLAVAVLAELGRDRRWPTAVMALGVASYLPQFFLVPQMRILHGLLLGAGCVAWALSTPRLEAPRKGQTARAALRPTFHSA